MHGNELDVPKNKDCISLAQLLDAYGIIDDLANIFYGTSIGTIAHRNSFLFIQELCKEKIGTLIYLTK